MIEKFLERVSDKLIEAHGNDFSDVLIVLPAQRARMFLGSYLTKKVNKTYWSPEYFVFPEFAEELSDGRIASALELSLMLFQSYKNITPAPESFTSFSQWSSVALKDFHDIDAYLQDSREVFSDLRKIKDIEGWSFNSMELSPSQTKYLDFWSRLGDLYDAFAKMQDESKCWSYHRLIRQLISSPELIERKIRGKFIYFVGIASFSPAEKALINGIKQFAQVETFFDFDAYYINDTIHEAGYFARAISVLDKNTKWIGDHLTTDQKEICIYECSTSISQIFSVADELRKFSAEELNETCVVLSEDAALDTLISCLSDMQAPVNVAMGVPLNRSSTSKWVSALLRMRCNAKRNRTGYYHKDLLQLIFLSKDLGLNLPNSEILIRKMTNEVWIYVSQTQIKEMGKEFPEWQSLLELLKNDITPKECITRMKALLNVSEETDDLNNASVKKVVEVLNEMEIFMDHYDFLTDDDAVFSLYVAVSGNESVHYRGEPLTGLQVLSMVETRGLDFKNVFFLGANEDFLPGVSVQQTFIPADLRLHYHLPGIPEKEAMFAYTFYRLLQRANNVHLYYSLISGDFKGTEQSRYITQIETELRKINPAVQITRKSLVLSEKAYESGVMQNDDFSKGRIDVLLEKGISPSAINKFNNCPMDFYYRYVIGLGEEDKMEEQMSSATFGSIIHYVLEKFYEKFKSTFPERADYLELKESIESRLKEALAFEYSVHSSSSGFNYLAVRVAEDMLRRIIDYELEILQENNAVNVSNKLIDVERMLRRVVNHEKHGWDKPLAIRGKVDRIDEINGAIRILDYKSGKVKSEELKLPKDLSYVFENGKSPKQLQLLSYIYMYLGDEKFTGEIQAGFYSFVDHLNGYLMLNDDQGKISRGRIDEFESAFVQWVRRLYELQNFEHNPESKYCQYCQ